MSSQVGILGVFSSKKLWTAPSKEQYLPAFFKRLCDEYMASEGANRVCPVKCLGLQQNSDPPTWVLGPDFHVEVLHGHACLLKNSQYCIIEKESGSDVFGNIHLKENLDSGETLKELILTMQRNMGDNFASAVLVLGGVGLAVHYELLSSMFDGVPVIVAYGKPVTGKSTAVGAAMAVLGQMQCIGECTLVGALNLICAQTIPFWWDDAADFKIIEKLSVCAFNKSQRKTAAATKEEQPGMPRTVPIITMNPTCLKSVKKDFEKLSRVFSRIAVIPFLKITKSNQSLEHSMALQRELKEFQTKSIKSVGVILELSHDFKDMREDPLFEDIQRFVEGERKHLDMRSMYNYTLLLFSTAKILEKLGLKEPIFNIIKDWFTKVVAPQHSKLTMPEEHAVASNVQSSGNADQEAVKSLIIRLVEKASTNPNEVETFFKPKLNARSCLCGEVFGFNVGKAIAHIGATGMEDQLRSYIRNSNIGCNKVKITCGKGPQFSGSHIKRRWLPTDLLQALDEAGFL